jgi:hypothetical protein
MTPANLESTGEGAVHAILQGSLTHFSAFHLLRMLRGAGATGRLELRRGEEIASVWVDAGRSAFARTTGPAMRVGDILIERGDLVAEAVEFAAAIQTDTPGERIGRMLVDSGALTEEQLRDALLTVQRDLIGRLLAWREGTFSYAADERIEGEDVRLDLRTDLEAIHVAYRSNGAVSPGRSDGARAA